MVTRAKDSIDIQNFISIFEHGKVVDPESQLQSKRPSQKLDGDISVPKSGHPSAPATDRAGKPGEEEKSGQQSPDKPNRTPSPLKKPDLGQKEQPVEEESKEFNAKLHRVRIGPTDETKGQEKRETILHKMAKRLVEVQNSNCQNTDDASSSFTDSIYMVVSKQFEFYVQKQLVSCMYSQSALTSPQPNLRTALEAYLLDRKVFLKYDLASVRPQLMQFSCQNRGQKRSLEQKKYFSLGECQANKLLYKQYHLENDSESIESDKLFTLIYAEIGQIYKMKITKSFVVDLLNFKSKKREIKRFILFLEGAH